MMHRVLLPTIAAVLLLSGGCERGGEDAAANDAASAAPTWLIADAPADALPVAEVKSKAAEGDTVVVHGRVGGRKDPISKGSAVFIIMDPAVPSCADMGDADHCPTPWDYCCETQASLTANSATVQLVDAQGSPLSVSADAGLDPLDEVIVVGTVGPRPTEGVLTIRATGVHRVTQ